MSQHSSEALERATATVKRSGVAGGPVIKPSAVQGMPTSMVSRVSSITATPMDVAPHEWSYTVGWVNGPAALPKRVWTRYSQAA